MTLPATNTSLFARVVVNSVLTTRNAAVVAELLPLSEQSSLIETP